MQERQNSAQAIGISILLVFVYLASTALLPLQLIPFLQIGFLGAPAFFYYQKFWKPKATPPKQPLTFFIKVLLGTIVLTVILNILLSSLVEIFPISKDIEKVFKEMVNKENQWGWLYDLFSLAIVPAICEEILYRGVLMQALQKSTSRSIGIALSAFIFALMHFNPWFFPFLFCLGIYFGLLFERSKQLRWPILAHFINNGIAVLGFHFLNWSV